MPSPPEYRDLVEKPSAFEKSALQTTMSEEMDESSLSVEQILALGKQRACEYLKRSHSKDLITKVLDEILATELDIDWVMWIIAGGKSPDEFSCEVKQYNKATICGLVWSANYVAYRCKTCGISPCMSLCVECFQRGPHEEHDFNMFRSQSGGACDCGDASIMQPSGFCDRHGVAMELENTVIPTDLMEVASIIAPRILFQLIKYLRNLSHTDRYASISDGFLGLIIELSNMGSVMREVLTKALVNSQEYQKFTRDWVRDNSQFALDMAASQKFYKDALESLKNPDPPAQFEDCPGLQKELIHNTFLEELFFWTVKFEFPEKIVYFLLNMLPDIEYKDALTEAFVMHYSRIAMILEHTLNPEILPNRVVHLNVQLFYRENLAFRMTHDFGILRIMIVSMMNMMRKILLKSNCRNTSTGDEYELMTVNCELPLIKECRYWPLVSDLNNILFHESVAREFMSNDTLLEMWFSFLIFFQGMNINQRELKDHVEFESNTYIGAFLVELEACAHPMWKLLSYLKNEICIPLLKKMLHYSLVSLRNWIECVDETGDGFKENSVSFHIPLHRYSAMLICRAVNMLRIPLSEILPTDDLIRSIIIHPLQIQVAFHEILNGLWVRNGLQIKGQALNYIQSDFCDSLVDADLYFLQILLTRLPASDFLSELIEKFRIKNWFRFLFQVDVSDTTNNDIDTDTKMLESFLQFVATLCCIRTNLADVSNYEFNGSTYPIRIRSELVTLLCVCDKPHSRLKELMPDRCGTESLRYFDAVLAQVSKRERVADYKAPITDVNGTLQQALYIPTANVWETLYDPLHVLLRVQKEDFQNSVDRFSKYVRQNNLLPVGTIPWPPYRIPTECNASYQDPRSILQSKVFHAIIWVILYKAVYVKNVPDRVISIAMYLLEMALCMDQSPNAADASEREYSQSNKNWIDVTNLELDKWFSCDRLSINLRSNIRYVMFASAPRVEPPMAKTRNQNLVLSTKRKMWRQNLSIINRNYQEKSAPAKTRDSSSGSGSKLNKFSANESIISMLLKLYSYYSSNSESFNVENIQTKELDNRIGDGAAFIAKVLIRITMVDELCREEVVKCCHRLCPPRRLRDRDKKDGEEKDESERKRIARERRQKIIEKYALQREEFLKKNINDEHKMDCDEETLKNYDCVICKETSPSKQDALMGLVVLVQPTNVLGHKRRGNDRAILPICDADLANFSNQQTLASVRGVGKISYWRNGVHVQTCGHHLHLECLKSHLQWLKNQQQKVSGDKLEFITDDYRCPLCRQLANNVLPMLPDMGENTVLSDSLKSDNSDSVIKKIAELIGSPELTNHLIEERSYDDSATQFSLMSAIKKSIDDMIELTFPPLKQAYDLNQSATMLQFITSVARSNLEIDLVLREGTLLTLASQSTSSKETPASSINRRKCLAPLLEILTTRVRSIGCPMALETWRTLNCGIFEQQLLSCDMDSSQSTPMLLRDPVELLIQIVLYLPLNADRTYFTCVTRSLYNLVYFQVMVQLSNRLDETERNYMLNFGASSLEKFTLDLGMKLTISSMHPKEDCKREMNSKEPPRQTLELQIQELCMPFLRIACLLRHYTYDDPLPDISSKHMEFQYLTEYLELTTCNANQSTDSSGAISWSSDTYSTISSWFKDFSQYASQNQHQVAEMAEMYVPWKLPRLLELPQKYSVLFQYYHEKACCNCEQVSQKGAICLVCGALVCFQQNCCKRENVDENKRHSLICGAGTAIFLAISSTCVIIIRGKRACVWGSIYLDVFGEEDIELKRGKPLFLSKERYHLLEQQWLSHRFDHTPKRWFLQRDTL